MGAAGHSPLLCLCWVRGSMWVCGVPYGAVVLPQPSSVGSVCLLQPEVGAFTATGLPPGGTPPALSSSIGNVVYSSSLKEKQKSIKIKWKQRQEGLEGLTYEET